MVVITIEESKTQNYYEVRSYERLPHIGVLIGGKTLFKALTFDECLNYCGKKGLFVELF